MSINCDFTPFHIVTSQQETQPGCWNYTKVEIFQGDDKCGEYVRHYGSFGEDTFCPVKKGDKWYALISIDYQSIDVLSLPDCKNITVKDENGYGFCPTEIYVPHYQTRTWKETYDHKNGEKVEPYEQERKYNRFSTEKTENTYISKKGGTVSDWTWADFGFVSGCYWGDDSSWKIQYLDLRRIDEGIVLNTPLFGYIHLPDSMCLRDAIDHSNWDEDMDWVKITHTSHFERETGKNEVDIE